MYNGYELNNSSGTFAKIRWERESFRDLKRALELSNDNGGPILIKNTFSTFPLLLYILLLDLFLIRCF